MLNKLLEKVHPFLKSVTDARERSLGDHHQAVGAEKAVRFVIDMASTIQAEHDKIKVPMPKAIPKVKRPIGK